MKYPLNKIKSGLLNFLQSTGFVYMLIFGAVFTLIDYKVVIWHAQAATLSRLQPPYDYLVNFADEKVPFDRKQLKGYRLFFTELLKILPGRPDGYGMLAFCEYHLGNTTNAINNFKKALESAPYFIWYNYDLAVIYFQKEDYEQAVKYLNQAVESKKETVLKFMLASKIYLDAATSVPGLSEQLPQRLMDGYRDSYKMLVLSYFKLKRYSEAVGVADMAINQKLDTDGFFYYYLGVGAFESAQYKRAALYFRETLLRNPQSPEAYNYLSLIFRTLNKEDWATSALENARVLEKTKGPSYDIIKNFRMRIF